MLVKQAWDEKHQRDDHVRRPDCEPALGVKSNPGPLNFSLDELADQVFLSEDGVIGRPSLWIAEDFWVLRFRLMVKRGPWLRPQASEGEARHGPFWRIGRIGQGDEHLHCG
jgi:hypothetical protein